DVIRQWDPKTGRELRRWQLPSDSGDQAIAAVNINRRLVASYGELSVNRPGLKLWDMDKGKPVFSAPGRFSYAVIAPSGKSLAAVNDEDHLIYVWQLPSGRVLHRLDSHMDKDRRMDKGRRAYLYGLRSLAFSPDEVCLGSIVEPTAVHLWQLGAGKE